MSADPEFFPKASLIAVLVGWPLALAIAWYLRRRLSRRFDRLGESTSEEVLDELDRHYPATLGIRIRTQTEYLPFVFECIREQVDSGFEDLQVRSLLQRIETHRPFEEKKAVFPIEVSQMSSDLRFQWIRDPSDRIELRIHSVPRVIRALRDHKRRIPRAVFAK